jgi:hypothetical protein
VLDDPPRHFVPSSRDAHLEILRVLREEPEDTVTIVAVGPLTNVAMAAIEDPEIFSRGSALSLYLVDDSTRSNSNGRYIDSSWQCNPLWW